MQSFVRKISIYRFLDSFNPILVIFTLLFSHNVLSTFQISLILVIWSVTQLILEIPTGILADKFSRKNILIVASINRIFGYGLWLIGGSFWIYTLGAMMWSIKNALMSGTLESFVYDELKTYGKEEEY